MSAVDKVQPFNARITAGNLMHIIFTFNEPVAVGSTAQLTFVRRPSSLQPFLFSIFVLHRLLSGPRRVHLMHQVFAAHLPWTHLKASSGFLVLVFGSCASELRNSGLTFFFAAFHFAF